MHLQSVGKKLWIHVCYCIWPWLLAWCMCPCAGSWAVGFFSPSSLSSRVCKSSRRMSFRCKSCSKRRILASKICKWTGTRRHESEPKMDSHQGSELGHTGNAVSHEIWCSIVINLFLGAALLVMHPHQKPEWKQQKAAIIYLRHKNMCTEPNTGERPWMKKAHYLDCFVSGKNFLF